MPIESFLRPLDSLLSPSKLIQVELPEQIGQGLRNDSSVEKMINVTRDDSLNGALRFQSQEEDFLDSGIVDFLGCLPSWAKTPKIQTWAADRDFGFYFADDDAKATFDEIMRISNEPFSVRSPFLENHQLYPFQHVGMHLCSKVERSLLIHSTGCGKTLLGSLLAQKLFDDDLIDICLVICKKTKKIDWLEYVRNATYLDAETVDGTRIKRHKQYLNNATQVLVLNYEKFSYPREKGRGPNKIVDWEFTDLFQILQMIKGKRVLCVMDEAAKIGNRNSLVSRGLRCLSASADPQYSQSLDKETIAPAKIRILALTATPYQTSPYNIRNIFLILNPGLQYVSGSLAEFEKEYQRYGSWHDRSLNKLGKRIGAYSHIALKSDPEIAAQFPSITERQIKLSLSLEDRRVYEAIEDFSYEQWSNNSHASNMGNFQVLRMVCNTAESLTKSQSEAATKIMGAGKYKLSIANSSKYSTLVDLMTGILEGGDKVVIFTYWANAVLPVYLKALREQFPNVPSWDFCGTGMSERTQQDHISQFNNLNGPGFILMSDAGQEGINLYCPYLIHLEIPLLYSWQTQRSNRIHRADSKAHGVDHCWIYTMVTEGTIEQRVAAKVAERKYHSEIIEGSNNDESRRNDLGSEEVFRLMFGDKKKLLPNHQDIYA